MSENCSHDCSNCGESCSERSQQSFAVPMNASSNIKRVIGVVSGKGGVGKSVVTSLLASAMQRRGFSAAVLDADLTGPSIPKMFGIASKASANEVGLLPVAAKNGTRIMSVNLLLENDTEPVVWRGPVIAGVVKQFWSDVIWGNVDYMFVDMPPGTGDVPLTVFQSLPLDGIVVVASPQELVGMIVEKAINMANMMNVPVIGLVENMSYFECPDCGKKHELFGNSHLSELAERFAIDASARIPISPTLAALCDKGEISNFENNWLDEIINKIEQTGE